MTDTGPKRVLFVGAGAMGGLMAGTLHNAGAEVRIVDTDPDHVAAIGASGLAVGGMSYSPVRPIPAETTLAEREWADLVVVMTTNFQTRIAAETARDALAPGGSVVTLQNGLGNVEALCEVLKPEAVFAGSTRASAQRLGPGQVAATKIDATKVGELDGSESARTRWFAEMMTAGGMACERSTNIQGVLWTKCIHNCAINAPCAISGLRMGETARVPELDEMRWRVVAECLAVAKARGVSLDDPDPIPFLRRHIWRKFTKPSMLQHMDEGLELEIDAINGFFVREGAALGVPTPMNEALTALAKARNAAVRRADDIDYDAWTKKAEAEVDAGLRG